MDKLFNSSSLSVRNENHLLSLRTPGVTIPFLGVLYYGRKFTGHMTLVFIDFLERHAGAFAVPEPNLIHNVGGDGTLYSAAQVGEIAGLAQLGVGVFFEES